MRGRKSFGQNSKWWICLRTCSADPSGDFVILSVKITTSTAWLIIFNSICPCFRENSPTPTYNTKPHRMPIPTPHITALNTKTSDTSPTMANSSAKVNFCQRWNKAEINTKHRFNYLVLFVLLRLWRGVRVDGLQFRLTNPLFSCE